MERERAAGRRVTGTERLAEWAPAAGILLFHLAFLPGYGVFRDELYYMACGRRPGWGYVDHPPLVGWVAWLVAQVAGESHLALRVVAALAMAATVWLAGRIAAALGGGPFAQRARRPRHRPRPGRPVPRQHLLDERLRPPLLGAHRLDPRAGALGRQRTALARLRGGRRARAAEQDQHPLPRLRPRGRARPGPALGRLPVAPLLGGRDSWRSRSSCRTSSGSTRTAGRRSSSWRTPGATRWRRSRRRAS